MDEPKCEINKDRHCRCSRVIICMGALKYPRIFVSYHEKIMSERYPNRYLSQRLVSSCRAPNPVNSQCFLSLT